MEQLYITQKKKKSLKRDQNQVFKKAFMPLDSKWVDLYNFQPLHCVENTQLKIIQICFAED